MRPRPTRPEPARRAVARRTAFHDAVCDRVELRGFGRVVRATDFPTWWDVNALVVERADGLTVEGLLREADRWLEGLGHRRVELQDDVEGAPLTAGLRDAGWTVERLVTMHRPPPAPDAPPGPPVTELSRADTDDLSVEWLLEDEVMRDAPSIRAYLAEAAIGEALLPGERVALGVAGTGFVSLRVEADEAEIEDAFVTAAARGAGLGTSLLRGAMARAGARDLWILADADGHARRLYERLGFQAAWSYWDCVRRPPA